MVILVEGLHDQYFLQSYLEYLNITNVNVKYTNGKDGLKDHEREIVKNNNTKIIFDADDDLELAKENIKNQLGEELFAKCEIFLIPNNKDKGNLETLIENIAKEKCVLQCFDNYMECLKTLQEKNQNIKLPAKKSKVYAYNHSFGYKNGDENYKIDNTYFDLESEYLEPLKSFLLSDES
ncbi:MAG: hypothetical protein MR025_01080 [Helicobacter trogontum]|uniref:DUF3226 domain-containing protein n=1 Tax=Helicobacter TaxID=209 RepID=UPI00242D7578|nr:MULTISPECIES: DUF3226 domain-containing protein [Helicobacter]MCI5786036.1 hypothetical protein [Helicobacter trogontum]MCI7764931.1 hypothetical protein [Helicobacter sp.]